MKLLTCQGVFLSGVASITLFAGPPAWAQQQSDAIETVTVTAEKQTERALDVPMGLTALSGEDLVRNQQFSFQDYVGTVPGLQVNDFGGVGSQIIIRGLSTGLEAVNPTSAIYVDDTPYSVQGYFAGAFGAAPNLDTYDMSNVEVLKGPQGTLYGADALGGLLKYVTNAPDPSGFAASMMVGTSTVYNGGAGYDAHGMVNIPLTDDLALRVVAYQDYTPGFIDNPWRGLKGINATNVTGGRASLLWEPASNFSVRLSALYQDRRYDDFSAEYVSGVTGLPYPNTNCVQPAGCPGGPLTLNNYVSQPGKSLNEVVSLTTNWQSGPMNVTSITSYMHLTEESIWDYSGLLGAAANSVLGGTSTPNAQYGSIPEYGLAYDPKHEANVWTQEIRLQSPDPSSRFTWLAGGYFESESAPYTGTLYPVTVATSSIDYGYSNPVFGVGNPYALGYYNYLTSYQEFAGFANIDYKLFPTLDAALGGRYSVNSQHFHEIGIGRFAGGPTPANNLDFGEPFYEHILTYSADLRWHFLPDNMAYARYATGFLPGGGNGATPATQALGFPSSFGPSTTKNYELGIKGVLFSNLFTYDMDAYLIDWESIQIQSTFQGHSTLSNGGTAHSQGFEWDFKYMPLDGLTLSWNGDYSDAKLVQTVPISATAGALAGEMLPGTPRWQLAGSINYERPLWGDWNGFAGANLRYSDFRLGNFNVGSPVGTAGTRSYMPQWTMLDFRIGIEDEKYTATLYCKNCTNVITPEGEQAWNGASSNTGAGYQNGAVYTPRTIGIELAAKF